MDLETFKLYTSQMTFEELHAVAVETMGQLLEARLRLEENEKVSTMLAKEYKAMEMALADCRKEVGDLKSMLSHSRDINVLRSNDMFGASSEKMSSMGPKAECGDPLCEEAPCDEKQGIQGGTISFPGRAASARKERCGREKLFKNLPVFDRYELDAGELDSRYCFQCIINKDGHLCCDNGYAERLIKPIALGRRNWLFNNTIEGAVCSCMTYSLVQTAEINGCDPYYYIQYVIEEMSKYNKPFHVKGSLPDIQYPEEFLSALVPWSEQYLAYEKAKKKEHPHLPDGQIKTDIPKSPRRKRVQKAG